MSDKPQDLKPRTKEFALRVIQMYSTLPKNDGVRKRGASGDSARGAFRFHCGHDEPTADATVSSLTLGATHGNQTLENRARTLTLNGVSAVGTNGVFGGSDASKRRPVVLGLPFARI